MPSCLGKKKLGNKKGIYKLNITTQFLKINRRFFLLYS